MLGLSKLTQCPAILRMSLIRFRRPLVTDGVDPVRDRAYINHVHDKHRRFKQDAVLWANQMKRSKTPQSTPSSFFPFEYLPISKETR